jgi:hypothetical protein
VRCLRFLPACVRAVRIPGCRHLRSQSLRVLSFCAARGLSYSAFRMLTLLLFLFSLQIESWMYEDGADAQKSEYKAKLDEFRCKRRLVSCRLVSCRWCPFTVCLVASSACCQLSLPVLLWLLAALCRLLVLSALARPL